MINVDATVSADQYSQCVGEQTVCELIFQHGWRHQWCQPECWDMCVCMFDCVGEGGCIVDRRAHLVERWWCGWGPKVQPVAAPLAVPASRRELPVCRSLIYTQLMSVESNVETVA